jgi:glycogen operon protein
LRRAQIACLMLAQGVPLLLAGDEVGNSQSGNNNAYCQDNEVGWVDWSGLGREGDDFASLIHTLSNLRRGYPQLRPRHWLAAPRTGAPRQVLWLTSQATEMKQEDWNFAEGRFLAYVLDTEEPAQRPLFIVINGAGEPVEFKFPEWPDCTRWTSEVATVALDSAAATAKPGATTAAPPRSVTVFSGAA